MKVSYIDAALAPPPPEKPFTTADDTLQTLREMRPGESLEIWPAADETLRGVRTSFTRIAKREDILIAIHPADSGRAIKVTRLR